MTHTQEIQRRWRDAFDAAAAAISSAQADHDLPSQACRLKQRALTEERRWLAHVVWADLLLDA